MTTGQRKSRVSVSELREARQWASKNQDWFFVSKKGPPFDLVVVYGVVRQDLSTGPNCMVRAVRLCVDSTKVVLLPTSHSEFLLSTFGDKFEPLGRVVRAVNDDGVPIAARNKPAGRDRLSPEVVEALLSHTEGVEKVPGKPFFTGSPGVNRSDLRNFIDQTIMGTPPDFTLS